MRHLDQVVLVLLIFAGINWGLWGLFEFNLIYYVFGREWVDRTLYIILGICGIYLLCGWKSVANRLSLKGKR